MSEETIEKVIVQVTPEVVKPKSKAIKNMSPRPSPKALLSPLREDDNLVPHYLRASTGSCHDLCKYGIKHDHEPKKLNPAFRKGLGKKEKVSGEQKQTMDEVLKESKKKTNHKERKIIKVQPPEKLLLDSPAQLTKESDQGSSSLNLDSSSQASSFSFGNLSVNQAEEPSEDIINVSLSSRSKGNTSSKIQPQDISEGLASEPANFVLDAKYRQNGFECKEDAADNQIDEYSPRSVNENFIVSAPVQHNISASSYTGTNVEASSEPQDSTEMITNYSIPRMKVGVEVPSNKMIGKKSKMLKTSIDETASVKLKNTKSPASIKGGSSRKDEKTPNGSPHIKIKTPSTPTKAPTSNPSTGKTRGGQTNGLSGEKVSEKSLSTNYKSNREVNKLKLADEENGLSDNAEVARKEKVDHLVESSFVEKNVSKRKTTKSAKLDSGPNGPSSKNGVASVASRIVKTKILSPKKTDESAKSRVTKNTALPSIKPNASVKPKAIKKQASISLRTTDSSAKPATSVKLKKVMVNSSSSLIPSGERDGQRDKSKINSIKDKQLVSRSLSNKSRLIKVPSLKLSRTKSISSASTMKNQKEVAKFVSKGKSSSITNAKADKIDLMAARQKLRKLRLYSFERKDGNEASSSKWSRVKKYVLRKDVTERNLSIVINGEVKRRHRRTASMVSLDKSLAPHMLNFSRGKVINPEPRNNTPVKLKFRRPTRLPSSSSLSRRSLFGSTSADSNRRKPEAETVVLRHQDLQDKKEDQVLFNNVIEETASKLVVTKKSKVKALVGAFESIFSLKTAKLK